MHVGEAVGRIAWTVKEKRRGWKTDLSLSML